MSRSSNLSRTSNQSKTSAAGKGGNRLKAPTSLGKATKSARATTSYSTTKKEKESPADKLDAPQQLNRSSSALSSGSGNHGSRPGMKNSMVSNYSVGSGNETLRQSLTLPDRTAEFDQNNAQKGGKGFLSSGLSAITSSLSRRLSYQPV